MPQLTLADRVYELKQMIRDLDQELHQLGDDYSAGYISHDYAFRTLKDVRRAMT